MVIVIDFKNILEKLTDIGVFLLAIFWAFSLIKGVVVSLFEAREKWLDKKISSLTEVYERLRKEAEMLSPQALSAHCIPENFSTKEAAYNFGLKWSLGDAGSFQAFHVDSNGRKEYEAGFDQSVISSGFLDAKPVEFFGMHEPINTEDRQFWIRFHKARNIWLSRYVSKLHLEKLRSQKK